jgi:hypothetical protein
MPLKTNHLLIGGLIAAAVAAFVASRPGTNEPAPRTVEREPQPEPPAEDMPPGHPATGGGALPPGHPATGGGETLPPGHPATGGGEALPPGHPATGEAMPSGHPATGDAPASADDAALTWKVPAKWKEVPSASSMRLATYRVGGEGGAECSVIRAGGTADANVDRWIGQFDEASRPSAKRSETTVRGLKVSRLEIHGTFLAGSSMGGPSESQKGWAMIGLVVATPGMPYFFKVTGPDAAVTAARADVDSLVASLEPAKPH